MTDKNMEQWRMNSLGYLVAVLGAQMAEALDNRLKELDLRLALWPTLIMLWEEDGLTQSELSDRCRTANYTTTRMLDTLEKKGLIERKPHPTSRRAHLVYLTAAGKALKPDGMEKAEAVNQHFMAAFSPEEQQVFMTLLQKLVTEPENPGQFPDNIQRRIAD